MRTIRSESWSSSTIGKFKRRLALLSNTQQVSLLLIITGEQLPVKTGFHSLVFGPSNILRLDVSRLKKKLPTCSRTSSRRLRSVPRLFVWTFDHKRATGCSQPAHTSEVTTMLSEAETSEAAPLIWISGFSPWGIQRCCCIKTWKLEYSRKNSRKRGSQGQNSKRNLLIWKNTLTRGWMQEQRGQMKCFKRGNARGEQSRDSSSRWCETVKEESNHISLLRSIGQKIILLVLEQRGDFN